MNLGILSAGNYYLLPFVFLFCQSCYAQKAQPSSITSANPLHTPYRHLENLSDSGTIQWFLDQNKKTEEALGFLEDKQASIYSTIVNTMNPGEVEYRRIRHSSGGYTYSLRKHKDEATWSLIRRIDDKEELLFNPRELDSAYTISYYNPSWDDQKIAIALTRYDQEVSDIVVLDVVKMKLLPGKLQGAYPNGLRGIQWLPDNQSIVYARLPILDPTHLDFFYNIEIVSCQADVTLAYSDTLFSAEKCPHIPITPAHFPLPTIAGPNSEYLYVELAKTGSYYDIYRMPLTELDNGASFEQIFDKSDRVETFREDLNHLTYLTLSDAGHYDIRRTSLTDPSVEQSEVLVSKTEDERISDFVHTSNGLYYVTVKNGVEAKLYHRSREGHTAQLETPVPAGLIELISLGPDRNKLWLWIEGWTVPTEQYEYINQDESYRLVDITASENKQNLADLVVKEVEVASHDGAMVPLSIIHRADAKLDGSEPIFLHAYGAYGISRSPSLHHRLTAWLEHDGIYAIAHVRGGGEKGKAWHEAARTVNKPNTWKDFIACADYLVKQQYTTPKGLCINGGSAGGICIGRAMQERPDLFAAAVIQVGFMNPYRRVQEYNGDYDESEEWGLYTDSIQRLGLINMDPYLNIKTGTPYPAILLTAGMHDSRVQAWHPGKFAARMQEATSSDKPVLLLTDFEGGHGIEASNEKRYMNSAQQLAFLLWQTGHPDFQPRE